jgi:hypothetical protein
MFDLKEVLSPSDIQDFHAVAEVVYAQDNNYIFPLRNDVEDIFNPLKNPNFQNGKVIRWVLRKNGVLIGRVAAFWVTRNDGKHLGGMGFFECANDQEAAFYLFNACENWLKIEGLDYMDGPINFGDRDTFWGLMIENKSYTSYRENYNPTWYRDFFESYGFEKIFEQKTSDISEKEFNFERFNKLAQRVIQNPKYSFKTLDFKHLDKFAEDFVAIYNLAWEHHEDYRPLTVEKIRERLKQIKPVILPEFAIFAYAEGKPAGFYVSILEVNQVFKLFKGNLNIWNKIRFLFKRNTINKVKGIIFGVIPEFQQLGLETGMIMKFYEGIVNNPRIEVAELAWIGDFNPKMLSMLESLGAYTTKVHYTYRKLFS